MIYQFPSASEALDQGDIIDGCPILQVAEFDVRNPSSPRITCSLHRVLILTQTCDLANRKTQRATVAPVHSVQTLVDAKIVKAGDVRGPIRAGRVYGWYFLPRSTRGEVEESIVDLRQPHTLPLETLSALLQAGSRVARIKPLYREHLARHFGDTYSRIGLPEPLETE